MTDNPDVSVQEILDELQSEDGNWEVFEQTLAEMTPIYHEDNEWLDIVRANISHAKPGGEIGVQADLPAEMEPEVSGPDILRLLDDLTAHEVEHVNSTNLDAKANFMSEYPNFGKLAGHVYNTVEDEYIDMRRKVRYYGMRSKLAYYVWLHMNTPERAPDVGEVEENEGIANALMTGLLEVALAGYMNGEPSDEVKDAIARVEPLIERARKLAKDDEQAHRDGVATQHEREVIAHSIIQVFLRYIPDPEEYDGDEVDERKRAAGGDSRELDDESPEDMGEPRIEMDKETEAEVEDLLEELMDDDEVPDPVPDGEPEMIEPEDIEDEAEVGDPEELDDSMGEELSPDDGGSDEGDMESDADPAGSGDSDDAPSEGHDPEVDDETIDPLDEDGSSEDTTAGEGESEDGEFDGPDRDIQELIDEYGRDALKVEG